MLYNPLSFNVIITITLQMQLTTIFYYTFTNSVLPSLIFLLWTFANKLHPVFPLVLNSTYIPIVARNIFQFRTPGFDLAQSSWGRNLGNERTDGRSLSFSFKKINMKILKQKQQTLWKRNHFIEYFEYFRVDWTKFKNCYGFVMFLKSIHFL